MPRPKATERRRHYCSWCPQTFSKQEHLARHIRSHTQEKPFACNVCKKAFGRSDTLLRHARSHSSTLKNQQQVAVAIIESPFEQDSEQEHRSTSNSLETSSAHEVLLHPTSGGKATDTGNTQILGSFDVSPPTDRHHTDLPASAVNDHFDFMGLAVSDMNEFELSTDIEMHWDLQPFSRTPVWLASSKFDLNTFNSAIMTPAVDALQIDPMLSSEELERSSPKRTQCYPQKVETIRRQWFTYLEADDSHDSHNNTESERTKIDEKFRDDLSQRLKLQIPSEPLPSTDFLMYFNRFNPIFPIVHAATFRPSSTNSLLLLSICAIGSSFLGCPQATRQGQNIFEKLNKAILTSWETVLSHGQSNALALIQASLIGQTFGMLSGKPRNLLLAQSFHNTIITWAKRSGIFLSERSGLGCDNANNRNLDTTWRAWVQEEEQARVSAALFVHDAEFSLLFNTDPNMRHSVSRLPPISPNTLWTAPTAQEWKIALSNSGGWNRVPPPEPFEVSLSPVDKDETEVASFRNYCELEGIAASINEATNLDAPSRTNSQLELSLLQFHKNYLRPLVTITRDPFCLNILWHSVYISLFADLNRLEMAAGRDGFAKSQYHTAYAKTWSRSSAGRRCALHGMMILQEAEKMPIGIEPAIHVPRALYCAAMIWYAYTEFGSGCGEDTSIPSDDWPEFETLGIRSSSLLFEAHGFKVSRPSKLESMTLVSLIDLLRRIGHAEISDRMATLMTSIVHGSPDGESPIPS